jgi:hypothetical protein
VFERDSEPGLLSEAINRTFAWRGQPLPNPPLTEEALTFECLRCGRALRAAQMLVKRTPGEVVYACPYDDATLVTIHDRDYSFSDGEVTILVGGDTVSWWEFMGGDDPGPGSEV